MTADPANLGLASKTAAKPSPVMTSVRVPVLLGTVSVAAFVGMFGVWAWAAPLAGAAVAPGKLVASGQNKAVQYRETGTVKEILVIEGDRVTKDQPVLSMERTDFEIALNRLVLRRLGLLAIEARLLAERDAKTEIVFPGDLIDYSDQPLIKQLMEDQKAEFAARLGRHNDELGFLDKRIVSYGVEIEGINAQNTALEQQLELLQDELKGLNRLAKQKLTTQERLMGLKRSQAALSGDRGVNIANIAKAQQSIDQAEQQIGHTKISRQEEASTKLSETRAEITDIQNQIRAAQEAVERVIIRAPTTGTVISLGVHTIGEVVQSGQRLIEILPEGEDLLVEARVSPQDIDVVTVGRDATVMFAALNQRTTPVVAAKVEFVSADGLTDPQTHQSYYLARLRLGDLSVAGIGTADLFPGMQVDTFIKTEDRTFLEYLVRPIQDSFGKAFREE